MEIYNIINNWHLLVFLFFCKFVNKYYLGEAGYRNKKGILFLIMVVNTI